MKPPLFPPSIFFLLVFIFISIYIPTSLRADDSQYKNCSSPFSCGSLSNLNIKYPFWGENRAAYCGQPDFQLYCYDGVPKIVFDTITYRILHVNLDTRILTLARDDYWNTTCPNVYQNNTFDPTVFQFVGGLVNVTLLYDCASPPSASENLPIFSQSCGTNVNIYYVAQLLYLSICKSVIIPVFEGQVAAFSGNNIRSILDAGFGLQWTLDNDQCIKCGSSDGECGYDPTNGQFKCFCNDGAHTTSCWDGSLDNDQCIKCNSSGGKCGYDPTNRQFKCFCYDGAHITSCSDGSLGPSSKRNRWLIPIIVVSAGGVGIVTISVWIICNRKRFLGSVQSKIFSKKGTTPDHNVETFMESYSTMSPRRYTYSEVKRMTNAFKDKLGEGGYGVVYKASLLDGRPVAVKVLSESKGNGEDFINEVASISTTSHVNVVSLLGFCYERNRKALIYEFMSNGSLDKFICGRNSSNAVGDLEGMTLYQIAIGIARGLEYLHRGCNTRILHLDIKPQNILLDEEFCPKISDFGLAKICKKKESIVSIMGMRGTPGFIAPEVFSRTYGGVSHKSDVYSYGMLVLEMVGRRKNFDNGGSHTSEMYFPDWIYKDLEQRNTLTRNVLLTEDENEVVRKMTLVSLWCIQTIPSERPSMSKVIEMLEGPLQSLPFPPKPFLHSLESPPLQFTDVSSSKTHERYSRTTQKDAAIE